MLRQRVIVHFRLWHMSFLFMTSFSIPSNWCCWSDLCILKVFDWKPNYLRSGLSLRLPNAQCLPKYSSRQPWFSLSVRKNGMPCNNKNLTILMVKWVVIFSPSYVCHGRNILDRAFWEKLPGLFSVLSFQLSRYGRNSFLSQINLPSSISL